MHALYYMLKDHSTTRCATYKVHHGPICSTFSLGILPRFLPPASGAIKGFKHVGYPASSAIKGFKHVRYDRLLAHS